MRRALLQASVEDDCEARASMRDSTARLSEIALTCGFNSQAHMTTAFKQRLGSQSSAITKAFDVQAKLGN
jgi:AraC-like DNA-binding protein